MPNELTLQEGDKVTLSVVCRSNPKCSIKWYKNDVEIDEKNKRFNFTQKGDTYSLDLPAALSSDFGFYTFVAKGLTTTAQSTCYVEIPPRKGKFKRTNAISRFIKLEYFIFKSLRRLKCPNS